MNRKLFLFIFFMGQYLKSPMPGLGSSHSENLPLGTALKTAALTGGD